MTGVTGAARASCCVILFALAACGSDVEATARGNSGSGGSTANGGSGNGNSDSGTSTGGATGIDLDASTTSDAPSGPPSEEKECDGIDNDDNGIIDDVDLGGDGVCDCLNIATLGKIGRHGESTVFTSWLNTRGPTPAADLDDQVLTAELLEPYQVIVVLNVTMQDVRYRGDTIPGNHEYSPAEVQVMADWVDAGGGVMATIGYESDEATAMQNVNSLLSFSGLGYDPARTNDASFTMLVDTWETHPTTDSMGTAKIINGVRPLTTAGTTVGWDEYGEEALQVGTHGDGRVAVWADEWITYDALWNDDASLDIELFWLNLLKWLTQPKECQVPIPQVVK